MSFFFSPIHEICRDWRAWKFLPGVVIFSENTVEIHVLLESFTHFLGNFMHICWRNFCASKTTAAEFFDKSHRCSCSAPQRITGGYPHIHINGNLKKRHKTSSTPLTNTETDWGPFKGLEFQGAEKGRWVNFGYIFEQSTLNVPKWRPRDSNSAT